MDEPSQLDLVVELSREVVGLQMPSELPLFHLFSRAYRERPDERPRPIRGSDDMLGFGIDTGIAFTPYIFFVAAAVIQFLVAEVTSALRDEASASVRTAIRRLIRRSADKEAVRSAQLKEGQLILVHRVALEKATELGLPPDTADLLADAMVGSLVRIG